MKFKVGQKVYRNLSHPDFKRRKEAVTQIGTVTKHSIDAGRDFSVEIWTYVEWPDGKVYSYKEDQLIEYSDPNIVLKGLL